MVGGGWRYILGGHGWVNIFYGQVGVGGGRWRFLGRWSRWIFLWVSGNVWEWVEVYFG